MTNDLHGFALPELPKHTDIQKKVFALGRTSKDFRRCHAVIRDGTRCGCQANTFEVFCHSHLRQGYGFFTLAVIAQVDAVK